MKSSLGYLGLARNGASWYKILLYYSGLRNVHTCVLCMFDLRKLIVMFIFLREGTVPSYMIWVIGGWGNET